MGASRSGRTAKIHCSVDSCGRVSAVALTPGHVADVSTEQPLLEALAPSKRLIADEAYDVDRLRQWLTERRMEP